MRLRWVLICLIASFSVGWFVGAKHGVLLADEDYAERLNLPRILQQGEELPECEGGERIYPCGVLKRSM